MLRTRLQYQRSSLLRWLRRSPLGLYHSRKDLRENGDDDDVQIQYCPFLLLRTPNKCFVRRNASGGANGLSRRRCRGFPARAEESWDQPVLKSLNAEVSPVA